MSLLDSLRKLVDGADLGFDECVAAVEQIVAADASPGAVAAFLVALRMKGETADELAGLASAMRDRALPVRPAATGLVDTCGTGGDRKGTLNVSTAAAFVVAGAGLPVAKHGNRAVSSRTGSADVLEALGVRLDLTPKQVERCIDEAGIGFMFAPAFHPAMARLMPLRTELRIPTSFNLLGPLTNPARPSFQLVGVGDPGRVEVVAHALARLGVERALVVHGADGADELTLQGDNTVFTVDAGSVTRSSITAADAGLPEAPLESLSGAEAEGNAHELRDVLDGRPGAFRDCVLLNAGAAFVAAGAADDVREGAVLAAKSIDSGEAAAALERLVDLSRSLP
ncbi:MAG TPA: anthranilate phosphoribosyltransferase [Actinomycetota bacterium]|nr:anthranilate phosphoribosyltransferase [Actinomycetota bacterium]